MASPALGRADLPPSNARDYAKWVSSITDGIVLCGVLLRIVIFLCNRAVWYDEAMLALNLIRRDWSELLLPLTFDQAAPVGFLLLEKSFMSVLGHAEMGLRALPLVCGIASVLVFRSLARLTLPYQGAAAATALFCFAPQLNFYSSEVKQYSMDVLVAVLLLWAAVRFGSDLTWFQTAAWCAGGAAAMLFSHPAAILLVAVGLYLAVRHFRNHMFRLACIAVVWGGSAYAIWEMLLRRFAESPYLHRYWDRGFIPLDSITEPLHWMLTAFPSGMSFLAFGYEIPWAGVPVAICMCLGTAALLEYKPSFAVLCVTPLLCGLVLAVTSFYPFAHRMLLYLAPLVCLLIGSVMMWRRHLSTRLLAGLIIAGSLASTVGRATLAGDGTAVYRKSIREAAQGWTAGKRLLVYGCSHECTYYALLNNIAAEHIVFMPAHATLAALAGE